MAREKSGASAIYHVEQELFVNTLEERPNDPPEDCRQISSERKGLALQVDATILF